MGARVRVDKRTNRLYLDLHLKGRRKRIFSELPATPRNVSILEAKAEAIEREVFLGTFDLERHFPRVRTRPVTVRELYEEWTRKKATEVTPLTMKGYRETIEQKVLSFWGTKRLDTLTPVLFDRFKAGLQEQKLAPRTVNIILMRLRQILRLGHERGYVGENPSKWVVLVRDGRPAIAPLSFEEKARFLGVLPFRWRPYFEIAFGTGLRPSEQIALTWDRVDEERNVIEVRAGWREGRPTPLKTAASQRDVDLLPSVRKALQAQRVIAGGSELVFPNRFGKHINHRNLRRRVWRPALKAAGLKRRDLYNTRHTFATHALASGEDPGWVAKMLGHTTLTMLMTRYYRYVPNLVRRDGTLLDRQLVPPKEGKTVSVASAGKPGETGMFAK
jgi:integrase